jgi:hypothetical protein
LKSARSFTARRVVEIATRLQNGGAKSWRSILDLTLPAPVPTCRNLLRRKAQHVLRKHEIHRVGRA